MRAPRLSAGMAALAIVVAAVGTPASPCLARAAASDQHAPHKIPTVSERVARDLAWSFGIVRIQEISLAGARWEVSGFDAQGNEKLLDISAYDGRVLN